MPRRALPVLAALAGLSSACAPSVVPQGPLLSGVGTPTLLAVDLSHVYVALEDAGMHTLARIDKHLGGRETVCSLPGPIDQLSLAADSAYWLVRHHASDTPVVAIQKAGKAPRATVQPVLRSRDRVTSFAVDATHVYWTQAGDPRHEDEARTPGVLRSKDPMSEAVPVAMRLGGEPFRLTLGGAHVYWITQEQGAAVVSSWPKQGGDPVEILLLHPDEVQGAFPALAATDEGVYVLSRRELVLIGSDGKTARRVKHGFVSSRPRLAFDYRYLYFPTDDGLMRMTPNASEYLPFTASVLGEYVVGDDAVYWIEGAAVHRKDKR